MQLSVYLRTHHLAFLHAGLEVQRFWAWNRREIAGSGGRSVRAKPFSANGYDRSCRLVYEPSITIIVSVLRTLSSFLIFQVTISFSLSMLSASGACSMLRQAFPPER